MSGCAKEGDVPMISEAASAVTNAPGGIKLLTDLVFLKTIVSSETSLKKELPLYAVEPS